MPRNAGSVIRMGCSLVAGSCCFPIWQWSAMMCTVQKRQRFAGILPLPAPANTMGLCGNAARFLSPCWGKRFPSKCVGRPVLSTASCFQPPYSSFPSPPNGHAVTLFSQRPFTATPLPLHCVGDGTSIHETAGYGLSITTEGHTLTMINRREEIIHQVDLVRCGSMEGYGSLLIKQDADQPLCIW